MSNSPPISDYMVAHPYTIQDSSTVSAAEKLMNAHRVRHLPVVRGEQIVGIISDRDIVVARYVYRDKKFDGEVLVKEICIFDPYVVDESESLDVVARTMAKRRLDAAIITKDKLPVGIFTTTDACRLLADLFKSKKSDGGLLDKLFG